MTLLRYSWTQPVCDPCFRQGQPGREPGRLSEFAREVETCCRCGAETAEGIYVRVDPETVPHPTAAKD